MTRASKDVPELILGSKDDQFTVNQKDFELIAGQGYRWKITAAGGLEYKFHHRPVSQCLEEPDRHQRSRGAHERRAGLAGVRRRRHHPGAVHHDPPGIYTWSVPDLADKGMKGTITIK